MKLSIIVVNFNTYEYTKNTIESVITSSVAFDYEIIVIDNASSDESLSKIKSDFFNEINSNKIIVIENAKNLGFAGANNIGIRKSNADYVLLLNSDTKVNKTAIQNSVSFLEENQNSGILTCKILLEDGALDHACKRGFPTPSASLYYFLGLDKKNPEKYGQYDFLTLDENSIGKVDVISGAFMLIPRKVIEKVGLLDEKFFMYGEDIDYCYRVKENGFDVIYYPKESIIHYKGKSNKKRKYRTIYDFHNSMWIFYKKHYIKKYNFFVSVFVILGILLKFIFSVIKNFLKVK